MRDHLVTLPRRGLTCQVSSCPFSLLSVSFMCPHSFLAPGRDVIRCQSAPDCRHPFFHALAHTHLIAFACPSTARARLLVVDNPVPAVEGARGASSPCQGPVRCPHMLTTYLLPSRIRECDRPTSPPRRLSTSDIARPAFSDQYCQVDSPLRHDPPGTLPRRLASTPHFKV